MQRPLDPLGLLEKIAIVECVCLAGCGTVAEIGTGRVPHGQIPSCPECGNPMKVERVVKGAPGQPENPRRW